MTSISALWPHPMQLHAVTALLLGALVALPAQAQTTQRLPVTELKPLLTLAVQRGSAHGVLTGPGADYMRRRFGATAPIEIDVSTVQALPQPGCSRLEVITRQRDVLERDRRSDQQLRWEISFCRDGSFPEKR